MAAVDQFRCPACQAGPGTLTITETLAAKPLGTWSLAGCQMKTSAYPVPVLTCSACGLRLVGEYDRHPTDPDKVHAAFGSAPTRTPESEAKP